MYAYGRPRDSQLQVNCFNCVNVLITMEQLPHRQCPRYSISL